MMNVLWFVLDAALAAVVVLGIAELVLFLTAGFISRAEISIQDDSCDW